jgi:hypothetical protein
VDRIPPDEQPGTVDQIDTIRDVSSAVRIAATGWIVALAVIAWWRARILFFLVLDHFGYHGHYLDVGTVSYGAAVRVAFAATAAYLAVIAAVATCLSAALAPWRPLVYGAIAGLTPFVVTAIWAWLPDEGCADCSHSEEFLLLGASLAGMGLGVVVARRMGRRRAFRGRLRAW